MFDIFYSGNKPNQFAHERKADSIAHAQQLSRTEHFWWITYLADLENWDYLYVPPPWQMHQRHAWPSQWQKDAEVYLVPTAGYTETNYHTAPVIQRRPDPDLWHVPDDVINWDTSWHADPAEPPMQHVFATQWWDRGGAVLLANDCASVKYHTQPISQLRSRPLASCWHTLIDCEFDYSWQPHPLDPPYTYVFGNQWWPGEVFATVKYCMPGASDIKYVTNPQAKLPAQPGTQWNILVNCECDYSWVPDPGDPPYIYVFGNQHWPAEIMPTVEYTVSGATERKFISYPRAVLPQISMNWTVPTGLTNVDLSWLPDPGDPPYIYQFGTQHQRTGGPVYAVPGATEVKYVKLPGAVKISKDTNWSVPDGVDTSTFDWTWHPDATESPYIYQFGTQHQRTGGPVYAVPGAAEVTSAVATKVKYVDQIRITTMYDATAIYEIDHLDNNAGQIPNTIKLVRYFDNYRDTLVRLAKSIGTEHEHVWICSSVCDYSNFDFSWHPESWQSTMLHVFCSNEQKFGDTFYMHVPTFVARAEKKQLLEWYDCNFVQISVPRRPMPVILHQFDCQVEAVRSIEFKGPLAVFSTQHDNKFLVPTVPLWHIKTKTVVPLSVGASHVIVPKSAVSSIKKQLYDYPYIDRTQRHLYKEAPLDIVFIDHGEPMAEYNWLQLPQTTISNQIHRSSGVHGRVAAYHAAARLSATPWFFAVFAKLGVDENFDWTWQPDRMQEPKHYIFHARNPVNGLVYGHQAMIAYNRQLVLENHGTGLDFTLDSAHEVVPIISGTARYTVSPWMAWRTAFRECIKLRASLPDVENEYRLNQWLKENNTGDFAKWSHIGAKDAVEYHESVNGDIIELKKSYDWAWLATYVLIKRGIIAD